MSCFFRPSGVTLDRATAGLGLLLLRDRLLVLALVLRRPIVATTFEGLEVFQKNQI